MESTPKKLIYSTSRNSTTFQVGILSSISLIKIDVKVTCTGFYVYVEIIYIDSSPDPEIFSPYIYSKPSDETYGVYTASPAKKKVALTLQTSKMSCQCLMPKGTFHPMNLQDKYKPIKDMYLQGSINPITTLLTGEPMEA